MKIKTSNLTQQKEKSELDNKRLMGELIPLEKRKNIYKERKAVYKSLFIASFILNIILSTIFLFNLFK